MTQAVTRLVAVAVTSMLLASCADTVVEVDSTDVGAAVAEDVAGDTTPTVVITGSPEELLAELSIEMSQLSAQIADDGDEVEALDRIDAIWVVARPQVKSTRPELVSGIDTSIEMARTAVLRVRPADADKAFSILTDLVDRYTGDG